MSRFLERLLVRDHIPPAIPPIDIIDQYGFKSTGSTTAALVDLTNRISVMLEDIRARRALPINWFHKGVRFGWPTHFGYQIEES